MPYKSISELPSGIKENLPVDAMHIFMHAFNSAHKNGDSEENCNKQAWLAVENAEYKKGSGGNWFKMGKSVESKETMIFQSPIPFAIPSGKKFRKEILYEGEFCHPQDKKVKIKITHDLFKELVNNFNRKLVDVVYVPLQHSRRPEDNTGNIEKIEIGDSVNKKGKKGLFANFNIALAEIAEKIGKTILGNSVGIEQYTNPETGKSEGMILNHVALTNEPYLPHLGDFEAIFSRAGNETIKPFVLDEGEPSVNLELEKENHAREVNEMDEKKIAELEKQLAESQKALELERKGKEDAEKAKAEVEKISFEKEVASEIEKLVLCGKVLPTEKDAKIKFAVALKKEQTFEFVRMLGEGAPKVDTSVKGDYSKQKVQEKKAKLSEAMPIFSEFIMGRINAEKAREMWTDFEKRSLTDGKLTMEFDRETVSLDGKLIQL